MVEIQIKNVTKKYGNKIALRDVNIKIESGVFGLLGSNGAGKTTLMKCLVSLLKYEGQIEFMVDGKNRTGMIKVGYLPQNFMLFKQLTVKEALEYVAILKNIESKNEIDEIINKVNLTQEKAKKVKKLSGGMLRRLGIAQALIGNPNILIIDEPTVGLDPKERVRIRNLLSNLGNEMIVIISTHIVEDLDAIANNVAILKDGVIVEQGDVEDLLSKLQGKVGTLNIEREDLHKYESEYTISSVNYIDNSLSIRIISDKLPQNSKIESPKLEDVYFYFNGVCND